MVCSFIGADLVGNSYVYAQSAFQVGAESTNPDMGYRYSIKRLREKITLLIYSFSPSKKCDYYKNLVNTRIAELKYISERKDIANIQKTSERYSATAGNATECLIQNNLDSAKKEELSTLFQSQIPDIEDFQVNFDPSTAEWRFLKYDKDYLQTYISQLSS